MRTSKIKVQAMTIPVLTSSNGERYWPMRPLCEAIELNWHSQAAKLHPPRYTPREHDVCLPGQPPMKQVLCLTQAEFEFWLKGLSSRKVNRTARLRVDQLRAHFFGDASAEKKHPEGLAAAAPKVQSRILNFAKRRVLKLRRLKSTSCAAQSLHSARSSISMIARRHQVIRLYRSVSIRLSNQSSMPGLNASTCSNRTSQLCCAASNLRSSTTVALSTKRPARDDT